MIQSVIFPCEDTIKHGLVGDGVGGASLLVIAIYPEFNLSQYCVGLHAILSGSQKDALSKIFLFAGGLLFF